jgi:hypothetical protein
MPVDDVGAVIFGHVFDEAGAIVARHRASRGLRVSIGCIFVACPMI